MHQTVWHIIHLELCCCTWWMGNVWWKISLICYSPFLLQMIKLSVN